MQHRTLGRYELLRVLGKGAMGVVYEGRDPNLDRHVAIKTIMVDDLTPEAAQEYEARFRTEARSAARLHHPNIVTVHDCDRDGDTAFLVMEYIQGDDLKQHLDRGARFSAQEALHIVCDLLAALDFAHLQGVVHRDVKPANLLVEPGGRLKLTDFGVARITGDKTRTQGTMVGTLKYMAPEQVQGLRVDSRADLFSAAVVAYQLFTGKRPFDGDNDFSIIHQIIGHTPDAPSALRPELPKALDAVILRAMAKDREQRYQTAAEFSAQLQAAFGASFSAVAPVLPSTRGPAPSPSTAPTVPGSGIGQELELEYWRTVRDSTDPHELELFLRRFPQGIYADLARRRLQRLGEAAPDPDRTVLQGATRAPAASAPAPTSPSLDPTLAMLARPSAPPAAPSAAAQEPSPTVAPTPIAASAEQAARDSGRRASRKPLLWGALAGAGVLAAAAVLVLQGRGREPAAPGAVSVAVPAAPGSDAKPAAGAADSTPAPPPVAQATAGAPVAATAASHAASQRMAAGPSPAQRRREPAPPARPSAPPQPEVAAAPEARPAPPAPAAAASPAPPSAPAPATAVAQRVPSPQEACKDKLFVAKDLCMHFECQKPELEKTPFCVKLRAEAKAREEAAERAQRTR